MLKIDELQIQNFRGIRELKLEGISEVNLLVGKNNAGKSTVLEVIKSRYQQRCPIVLISNSHVGSEFIAEKSYEALMNDKDELLEMLKHFDTKIEDLQLSSFTNREVFIHLIHSNLGHVPFTQFGEGIKRILTIAIALYSSTNGILLIDEIENSLHIRRKGVFFSWLINACIKHKVQMFATTHSLDAIDGCMGAFMDKSPEDENMNKLVIYRLVSKDDQTKVVRISGVDLVDIRYEYGLDVR